MVPINGLKDNKNLKAHLVKLQLPDLDQADRFKLCRRKNVKNMKQTYTFKSKHLDELHKINKTYHCNSVMAIPLIEFHVCGIYYTGSTKVKFRSRTKN